MNILLVFCSAAQTASNIGLAEEYAWPGAPVDSALCAEVMRATRLWCHCSLWSQHHPGSAQFLGWLHYTAGWAQIFAAFGTHIRPICRIKCRMNGRVKCTCEMRDDLNI